MRCKIVCRDFHMCDFVNILFLTRTGMLYILNMTSEFSGVLFTYSVSFF